MGSFEIHLGEAMALAAAVTWALAVIFFRKSGEVVHPIGLNLFKNVMAAILLVPTAWLFGETLLRPAPMNDYLLLLYLRSLSKTTKDFLPSRNKRPRVH